MNPGTPATRRFDGKPETPADTRFFDLRASGYTGPIDQDGYATAPPAPGGGAPRSASQHQKGTQRMPYTRTGPAGPRPGPRRHRQAAADAVKMSLPWLQLAAMTGEYEPEDDSDMLAWMRGEASGLAAYAEAIEAVHETTVTGVGLDPAAMAALSDYADAAAEAGEAFAAARDTFARHYAEVREFAAGGGVIPYSGRWMAGDD